MARRASSRHSRRGGSSRRSRAVDRHPDASAALLSSRLLHLADQPWRSTRRQPAAGPNSAAAALRSRFSFLPTERKIPTLACLRPWWFRLVATPQDALLHDHRRTELLP